ncbi:Sec-independent protein translocase protein TatB [Rhodanobacter sp. AS-Z3]|uniref:Sec-independent protein translocase protein TatB n=1 Tax=Rhodanobacter sp. AS-Z3 TaxID=3031330 RepID=UPI00247865B1|nr:Sec-independent protein translocase protein TatB [Rhodanobacter sp. AS-Z3]WEN14517.1 Sec-independent protein translocase protein TatB [Rhodanobacter sp. AS-Z3]
MIDFSLTKLLFIAVLALIVLGPEKLPGAARTAGAVLRRVRGSWDSVRAEVERELQVEEIRRAALEVAKQGDVAKGALDAAMHDLQKPVQTTLAGLEPSALPEAVSLEQVAPTPALAALPSDKAEVRREAAHAEVLS